ncbi:hypothetical protein ACK6D9_00710 [Hoeflea sp. Naph1]|uniref:hypothetical protein n=1 Tax=Hoeflea sp. Naph1 TaxID=3388653 RepID=UPI00398FAB98
MENNQNSWQIERRLNEDGTHQNFITHLKEPRFTARVVAVDPFEDCPIESESTADLTAGIVYKMDRRTVLCETTWADTLTLKEHQYWLAHAAITYHRFAGHFMRWKLLPPIEDMSERLRLDLSDCRKWSDFTTVFGDENDRTQGDLVERIQKLACVVSSGELPVLQAILHAADYSRVADELAGDDNWRRLSRTSGDHVEAVALAIMRA